MSDVLTPATEQKKKNHAKEGKTKDYENPEEPFDWIRVAFEAIHDCDDVQHQNNQTK